MKNVLRGKEGMGLIVAILIILIISVMMVTIASLLGTSSSTSINYMQSQQAFYMAESGVQKAFLAIKNNNWTGWSGTTVHTLSAQSVSTFGQYDVSVDTTASPMHITATGYFPAKSGATATRIIGIDAASIFGKYGGYAGGSAGGTSYAIKLSGSALIDSYNSGLGAYGGTNIGSSGDISTAADIQVSGSPTVKGNATIGSGGKFSDPSHTYVKGTVSSSSVTQSLPAVTVPSYLTGLTNLGSITNVTSIGPGNYKYSNITIASTYTVSITGPANIYLTGSSSIDITRSASIEIVSGAVTFYVAGTVNVAGAGVLNDSKLASNLQIYGTSASSQSISISNGGTFYGAIYAPMGAISITGNADVYGSMIGDTLTVGNSGKLHHDVSLTNASTPSQSVPYVPANWKETY